MYSNQLNYQTNIVLHFFQNALATAKFNFNIV